MRDPTPNRQVIAMHGWGGDSRAWQPWQVSAQRRGWCWQSGERGYGTLPPHTPAWPPGEGRRAVIVHSLGLHLLPAAVLERSEAVVLLASFSRFVPEGAAGRPWRVALRGMAARLEAGDGEAMLQDFLGEAAAPDPAALLPPGPCQGPLQAAGVERLRQDLRRLEGTTGLPPDFPSTARVLMIEAGADRIVAPVARLQLRLALPAAEHWPIEAAGHSLLRANLVEPVLDWLEANW
jgi:pimeloyl-[acyl-carrier protein] methyl ester esterase